jgi:hypothetical protein
LIADALKNRHEEAEVLVEVGGGGDDVDVEHLLVWYRSAKSAAIDSTPSGHVRVVGRGRWTHLSHVPHFWSGDSPGHRIANRLKENRLRLANLSSRGDDRFESKAACSILRELVVAIPENS